MEHAPKSAFRIGGIYQTQGGELRRITDDTKESEMGTIAVVEHINKITGAASNRGSWRCLSDGKWPNGADQPNHRAHLLPGELMPANSPMGGIVWAQADDVVDAEVHPAGDTNLSKQPAADKPMHCGKHGLIFDGNTHANCPMCAEEARTDEQVKNAMMIKRDVTDAAKAWATRPKAAQQEQGKTPAKPTPPGLGLSPDLAPASHLVDPVHGSEARRSAA